MNRYLIAAVVLLGVMWSCAESQPQKEENKAEEKSTTQILLVENDSLLSLGKTIAQQTAKALGGNLNAAMSSGGSTHAVSFCSEKAIPITDSLSDAFGVRIQRIAERNRNAQNSLDEYSSQVFELMRESLLAGETVKPLVIDQDGLDVFYAPIPLKGMCVTCHGSSNEILPETMIEIQSKYPNDAAVDFKPGDLRGLWKITWSSNGKV